MKNKHAIYTGQDARGRVVLKCRCGFATVKPTEREARAAHRAAQERKAS